MEEMRESEVSVEASTVVPPATCSTIAGHCQSPLLSLLHGLVRVLVFGVMGVWARVPVASSPSTTSCHRQSPTQPLSRWVALGFQGWGFRWVREMGDREGSGEGDVEGVGWGGGTKWKEPPLFIDFFFLYFVTIVIITQNIQNKLQYLVFISHNSYNENNLVKTHQSHVFMSECNFSK